MDYTITPLTPHTGAEIRGLDLTGTVDPETHQALNRAFADHHVLVIRGQNFTPPQFLCGGTTLRRTAAARQEGAARPRLSADVLCLERADGAGQALYLG